MYVDISSAVQTKAYQYSLEDVKKTDGAAAEEQGSSAVTEATKAASRQDVYETTRSSDSSEDNSVTYKPNQALVEQLKAEQEQIQARFLQTFKETIGKQAAFNAFGDDGIWKLIASGNYTVDPEMKAAAEEAISEDGYWGVEQTSQRIVDFAKALSGGDPEMLETVKEAVKKGFEEAEEAWGGSLPGICGKTYDAVMSKLDEWGEGTAE